MAVRGAAVAQKFESDYPEAWNGGIRDLFKAFFSEPYREK
jgi:hypothetical protein